MQRKGFHLLVVAALLLASAGCGSTATIDRFQTFATDGTKYTQTVGTLLTNTSGLLIDANSLKLLESQELAPVSEADFRKQDENMRRQVRDLRLLQRQVDLLGEYFSVLANLAGVDSSGQKSDSSGNAGDTVSSQIAGQLGDIGSSLSTLAKTLGDTNKLATDASAVGSVVSDVGKIAVQGVQADLLRKELETRGKDIARVLRQQAELLKALAEEAESAQGFLNQQDYEQKVVAPFLSGSPSSNWKDARRCGLTQMPIPDSLREAVQAAANLRLAWTSLLANELDTGTLEAVRTPLASIDALQSDNSNSTDCQERKAQ